MFTGIIEAVGKVAQIVRHGEDYRLTLDSATLDLADVKLGDSIAVNGVCLTVVDLTVSGFSADVSVETLQRAGFERYGVGAPVNLEKAMLATSRFGGHIVSGHVDGVGEISSRSDKGRAIEFWLTAPSHLAHYIAEKGSITVDGVSLTVNSVEGARFRLTIIPHTLEQTIMANYRSGTKVNLEVDVIARYLERLLDRTNEDEAHDASAQNKTLELLSRSGFLHQ